jgi:hypothetical protein
VINVEKIKMSRPEASKVIRRNFGQNSFQPIYTSGLTSPQAKPGLSGSPISL